MADDIDEIMMMIESMQCKNTSDSNGKENLRVNGHSEKIIAAQSANDELFNIMKSIEEIQNMPPAKVGIVPEKPSRLKAGVVPPQKPSRKKKATNEKDNQGVKTSERVNADSRQMTTTQDIDCLLKDLEQNIISNKEAKRASLKTRGVDAENELDSVLNDMIHEDELGVAPTSKGICPTCGRPVMGEAVAALGKVWHREHFVCTIDDKEIGTEPYFSWNNQIYCEQHYNELFSPQCSKCQKPILENMINAMNTSFHQMCFTCSTCDLPFTTSFHEHEGKPFCQKCYSQCVAPKCVSCGLPILSIYTAALDGYWHPKCFVCQEPNCGPFNNAKFFDLENKPYCEKHYLQRIGAACAQCQQPINGKCVSAMGKRFHPQHFICNLCRSPLTQGIFKEHFEKPYCHPCFQKIGKRYN